MIAFPVGFGWREVDVVVVDFGEAPEAGVGIVDFVDLTGKSISKIERTNFDEFDAR